MLIYGENRYNYVENEKETVQYIMLLETNMCL